MVLQPFWYLVAGCAEEAAAPPPESLAVSELARCEDDDEPVCEEGSRGELVSVSYLKGYSKKKLEGYWDDWLNGLAALGYVEDSYDLEISNGADMWQIEYCTEDFDGTPILASGLLAMPRVFATVPTVVYAHGTSVFRFDTPTNFLDVDTTFDGPTPMVMFAGGGYLFLAPDLTGFGSSEAPRHRYFDAETEAASTLDLLLAADEWWLYELQDNGDVLTFGFSQGGHTALAFSEAAEDEGIDVQATAVVGAVAAPEPWFDWLLDQTDNSYLQLYTGYLLVSYDDVYDVYADPADVYVPPYDTDIDGLYDMSLLFFEVAESLPGSAAELLTPEYYDEAQDETSAIRTRLAENAVDDVVLDHPIRMYHSIDDGEVPFYLGEDAANALSGANDVELLELEGLDHLNAWHESLPLVRDWFDTF